jgi:hypothetical protein
MEKTDNLLIILFLLLFLGYIWTIPKEEVYNAIVTIIAAAIAAGLLLKKKRH